MEVLALIVLIAVLAGTNYEMSRRHHALMRRLEIMTGGIETVAAQVRRKRSERIAETLHQLQVAFPEIKSEIDEEYAETIMYANGLLWIVSQNHSRAMENSGANTNQIENDLKTYTTRRDGMIKNLIIDKSPDKIKEHLLTYPMNDLAKTLRYIDNRE